MRQAINQFIWGFQPHFRMGIARDVEACLEAIGVTTPVQVLLVGFATDGEKEHPICVEPEWGAFTSDDLQDVVEQGEQLYHDDPESQIWHSYRPLHDARQQSLRLQARARAVKARLESHEALNDHTFFVSRSAPIAGYEVHVCIGLPNGVLEALPVAGTEEIVERMPVEASLLTSIIHEILNSADQALELPHPGETLYPFRQSRFDVVREAALRFTQSCVIRSGDIFGGEVFEHMNEITATSYEGSAAGGHLLLASSAIDEAIDVLVRLDRSIHLRNTRAIRKLLEVTSQDFRLLIDDNGVYGIGKVREGADLEQARHAFPIEVTSHATWELRSHEAALMRVSYGVSALPRPLLDRARFRDAVLRLFPEAGDEHLDRLWDLLQAAAQASHGTILAIVDQAEAEAVRLQGESTRIHPTELTPELVSRVSGIDGAILVDSVGCCHAIGLILDGPSGEGDSARGARYNSALRYSRHPDLRTLLLVVSEDGSVELLPEQRPRVAASRVVAAIEDFREAVATGDGELYAKARARVEEISFYLDAAQCEEANSIDADEQERRRAEGGIVITGRCFEPNPEMDESYLLPQ